MLTEKDEHDQPYVLDNLMILLHRLGQGMTTQFVKAFHHVLKMIPIKRTT